MKHSILCIDDELDNVEALERIFRRKYRVLKATSGAEGLDLLRDESALSLIICDQRMPHMTGVEFFKKSLRTHPDTIRILLTGYTDINAVVDAVNSGEIYRYLTKPWDPVDLANTVDKAIEKFELRQELVIKNQALNKALDELKTLDQAKTQFMVLINHELKTPLTVLMSYLELLGESELSEEQKKYLSRLNQSTHRLKTIIDEVLALVSAETGQLKIHPSKIDLASPLEKLKNIWQERCETRKLNWSHQLQLKKIKADKVVVEEVLKRLTDNATKFATEGSSIEITTELDHENEHFTRISVRNEGKAIPAKMIEKILRPFTIDEDMFHHTKGLGLGLSVSQALLKTHGSHLEISHHKGQVEFSFRLPSA